jgi:hypothetical protein
MNICGTQRPPPPKKKTATTNLLEIQSNQKVSVHLMITIQSSGAQRLFDHSVALLHVV